MFRDCFAAFCSSASGAPLRPLPGPAGAPPPFVRVRVHASPLVPSSCVAPLLGVLSFDVIVQPLALLLPRLRCRLCLSSQVLLRPQCNGSWVLAAWCSAAPGRYSALGAVFRVSCFSHFLCCPWDSDVAYALARGRPSVPCATTRGRFAAYHSIALLLRVSFFLVAALPGAPAARGALLSPIPGPVDAPPPFV